MKKELSNNTNRNKLKGILTVRNEMAIRGITLVALVVTIVVLLILAGITISYIMGDNSVFKKASDAKVQTEIGKIEERAQVIYADKLVENTSSNLSTKVETSQIIEQLREEGYTIEQREVSPDDIKGIRLDKESITMEKNKTAEIKVTYLGVEDPFVYYVEVQGKYYQMYSNKGFITIDRNASNLTKADFEGESNGGSGTTNTLTVTSSKPEVATAKLKEGSNETIEVTSLSVEDSTEITVTYGKFDPLKCIVTVTDLEIEESVAFSRANGVIDIVWLDTENNVISEPISPANYLGGLTAIKYNETTNAEEIVNNPTTDTSWYNYVAQIGTNDGKTSNWANARSSDSSAYFVWIPRYAYKITYFKESADAEAYRADRNSKTGIIGYSNINGLVDVQKGIEKLVKGSEPINLAKTGNEINKVKSAEYADYIPHPAFEFDGTKAGIWVGKFESSGSTSKVTIIPKTKALVEVSVSDIFTACQGVKTTYSLTGDSHMMKNIEWGAVAYLAESKYGRNGTEITKNNYINYFTGDTSNVLQSTTGNIYGIYDMSGGAWEYVAGYINNSNVVSNGYNTNLINAVKTNPKYADVYPVTTDDQASNYSNSKGIKGDAVFETSYSTSWHSDYAVFPSASDAVFGRGRCFLQWSEYRGFCLRRQQWCWQILHQFSCSSCSKPLITGKKF